MNLEETVAWGIQASLTNWGDVDRKGLKHPHKVILTPIRAANANAHAERVIETIRAECLDWTLILGRRHLDRTLRTYAEHYNRGRPHRGLALATPLADRSPGRRHLAAGNVIEGHAAESRASSRSALAMVAGCIGGLASWIGALLKTAQLEDKTWFIVLLVLGLLSCGLVAMIAYLIGGPAAQRPARSVEGLGSPA